MGAVWHVVWEYLSAALLLGWLTTAVFCAVAGTALAIWARWPWPVGLLVGLVGLALGLVFLVAVGGVRMAQRRTAPTTASVAPSNASHDVPATWGSGYGLASGPSPAIGAYNNSDLWGSGGWYAAPTFGQPVPSVPSVASVQPIASVAPAPALRSHRPPGGTGWRTGIVKGWQRWTRTPPTRAALALAVLCALTSVLAVGTAFLGWVKVIGPGGGTLYAAGPFEIQLGLFVVFTAMATVASAVGLLRWRSGWWPVLLAWCGTWWAFLAVAVLSVRGELGSLSDLLDDTVAERVHVRQRVGVGLGPAWTVLLGLAALLLIIAFGMLVLQRNDPRHRVAAPGRTAWSAGGEGANPDPRRGQ